MEETKTQHLATLCSERANVTIHTGDATQYLREKLLPTIHYEKFNRALCLLDPYGLHLDWDVILQAGKSGAIDMFLNFPVVDMNRNAIWKDSEKVPTTGRERMTKFWGDESWKQAAYEESRQGELKRALANAREALVFILRAAARQLR